MIEQTKDSIKVEIEYTNGDLPYVVFWQSLNGLPCFEHHRTLVGATVRVKELELLGRIPILFLRVN